jgi:hypothetical protein
MPSSPIILLLSITIPLAKDHKVISLRQNLLPRCLHVLNDRIIKDVVQWCFLELEGAEGGFSRWYCYFSMVFIAERPKSLSLAILSCKK